MIDITVEYNRDTKVVELDGRPYKVTNQMDLILLIETLIDKVKYSGESLILYSAHGEKKRLVKEW